MYRGFASAGREYLLRYGRPVQSPFREIQTCFVRKDHSCGKLLNVSKACFVACPSDEEIHTMLDLISEKLAKIGVEPIIAVRERVYGQDIFCTKICGKIIESQFCIVILDDTKLKTSASLFPNPNVYYEYGLMTALGKHIIPLQRQEQALAFNIQTHDTIKYTQTSLSGELDRALKDAVKKTQEERAQPSSPLMPDRTIIRSMELNGFQRKDSDWFLSEEINDTVFQGLVNPETNDCLLLNIAQDKETLENALSDAQVIIKRMHSRHGSIESRMESLTQRMNELSEQKEKIESGGQSRSSGAPYSSALRLQRANEAIEKTASEIEAVNVQLQTISHTRFALILGPQVSNFKDAVTKKYASFDKHQLDLRLCVGDSVGLSIGEKEIGFSSPLLT